MANTFFGTMQPLDSEQSPRSEPLGLQCRGLVSRAGVIPYSFTQDAVGPRARTVTDAAKLLNVLVGYDPKDPATAWNVGNTAKNYENFLKTDGVKGKRIGVLRSFFGNSPIHEEVNTVANVAVQDLRG